MVHDGNISYQVQLVDVVLDDCEILLPHEFVRICQLRTRTSGNYEAGLVTTGLYDEDRRSTAIGSEEISLLLARMSALLNARVFPEQYIGERLPLRSEEQSERAIYRVSRTITTPMDTPFPPPRKAEAEELAKLMRLAAQPWNSSDLILALFRTALIQAETLGRFMLLYQCLLQIVDDRQQGVDNLILDLRPHTAVSPSPLRPSISETLYTRLRNEVAHVRGRSSVSETLSEIAASVNELRSLVHQALSLKVLDQRLV